MKKLPHDIRAALIDMDGVLYDSMPGHAKAWKQMMAENGIETTEEEFFLYEGMTGAAVIDKVIRRELGRAASRHEKEELYRRKTEIFKSFGRKDIVDGAGRMLQAFMDAGIPRVLVTGSGQDSLLRNIATDFPGAIPENMRVTARDVAKGKPDPEPYIKGALIAGVEPCQAIVVENAPLGVRAGKAAGCFTVAVMTGPVPRDAFERENADMIFNSMEEFALFLENNLPVPSLAEKVDRIVAEISPATVTVVTDRNVDAAVMPLFSGSKALSDANKVVIEPGEDHKNVDSLSKIWMALEEAGATRKSLVLNIGGGLVTDIGGFAGATYKRGIRVVNVPTTLLGAVDAATGGKTAINFNGLKNEIGAFHQPSNVMISAKPFRTLPYMELISGYAEMLKTGFIADANLYESLLDVDSVLKDETKLEIAVNRCVEIKQDIVEEDPTEKGLRKILNFGHTAGHAFESLLLERHTPVAHGVAVAHGMLVELILSHTVKGFPSHELHRYVSSVLKPHYPRIHVSCSDQPALISLMSHDKKNATAEHPNFTLLESIGKPVIDCLPEIGEIEKALEIYRDMMC